MNEQLIYTNSRGESIEFSAQSVYHVNVAKDVTGLTDVKSEIYATSSMGQHGDTYVGNRILARDIEVVGSINQVDKTTMLTLRRNLAKILNPELGGTLTYTYNDMKRVIQAWPEVAPSVSKSSVLTEFTVEFYCNSPYWEEEAENKIDVATWIGTFEFEAEIDINDGMEFGYREPAIIVNCYNSGDVEVGMRIVFTALGTVENPQLLNLDTREYIQINTTMQAGDVITVTTKYGEKRITLSRNGVDENYYRYIDVDSTFMQLAIGDNLMRYDASDGVDNLEVTIYHGNRYLGV